MNWSGAGSPSVLGAAPERSHRASHSAPHGCHVRITAAAIAIPEAHAAAMTRASRALIAGRILQKPLQLLRLLPRIEHRMAGLGPGWWWALIYAKRRHLKRQWRVFPRAQAERGMKSEVVAGLEGGYSLRRDPVHPALRKASLNRHGDPPPQWP